LLSPVRPAPQASTDGADASDTTLQTDSYKYDELGKYMGFLF